jgi:large subunit ribosomal protein L3
MKMAGRYGGKKSSVKNLEVIKVDKENNLLYLKGAVPGANKNRIAVTK